MLYACKGEHTLYTGQREREINREREKRRERERDNKSEKDRENEECLECGSP